MKINLKFNTNENKFNRNWTLSVKMVKRNTNFKQMFLADNILIDVINSQSHSSYKNANNFAFNQHNSCVECENYKSIPICPIL